MEDSNENTTVNNVARLTENHMRAVYNTFCGSAPVYEGHAKAYLCTGLIEGCGIDELPEDDPRFVKFMAFMEPFFQLTEEEAAAVIRKNNAFWANGEAS